MIPLSACSVPLVSLLLAGFVVVGPPLLVGGAWLWSMRHRKVMLAEWFTYVVYWSVWFAVAKMIASL